MEAQLRPCMHEGIRSVRYEKVHDTFSLTVLKVTKALSICFDEETEERRLRGSRRLKYSSSDKDHGKDYDDESKEEEGSERQF